MLLIFAGTAGYSDLISWPKTLFGPSSSQHLRRRKDFSVPLVHFAIVVLDRYRKDRMGIGPFVARNGSLQRYALALVDLPRRVMRPQ